MPLETQSMLSTKCLPCSQYYVKNVKLNHHNTGTNYFKKTYLPFLWHWNWEAVSLVRKKPFRMKTTGRKQRKELQQSVEGNHSKGVIHFTKVLILSYILWRSHLVKFRKKKKLNHSPKVKQLSEDFKTSSPRTLGSNTRASGFTRLQPMAMLSLTELFWDISHCSPGWFRIHYVPQAGLNLTAIFLLWV